MTPNRDFYRADGTDPMREPPLDEQRPAWRGDVPISVEIWTTPTDRLTNREYIAYVMIAESIYAYSTRPYASTTLAIADAREWVNKHTSKPNPLAKPDEVIAW